MSQCWRGVWPAVVVSISVAGCSQPVVDSGPSYAELAVTYNAELAGLDRLEAKRKELIADYTAASASNASVDTLAKLEGLLGSVKDLKQETNSDATSSPNAQLDDLIQRHGEAQQIAGQLLDGLLDGESHPIKSAPTPEEADVIARQKAAFEAELANYDAEITKQRERVERARQARDAAEQSRPPSK